MAKEEKKSTVEETTEAETPEVDVSIEDGEVETLKKELDKQKDLALRTAAEFDNFKKRTERDKIASLEFMKADILKSFLPVLDNFGRALETDPSGEDFQKGIEMISKQLTDVMVKLGLSEINDEGKGFDPNLHQAVLHVEDDTLDEGVITDVLQCGYMYREKVLRYAMVKVAN